MNNTKKKIIKDYEVLKKVVDAHRTLGYKIICTIGSWDLLHIGHLRYLHKAKEHGDVLIVGADSDRSIKLYKNKFRPIIPEEERLEMLSYQGCVDFATLIDDIDETGTWHYELIRVIQPDIFVCIDESYPKKQKSDIRKHAKKLVELPRQATKTSTSSIIEKTFKNHLGYIKNLGHARKK